MTVAGEQNHRDLLAIVDEVNSAFAPSIAFVFIPGDVSDDGSDAEYTVVHDLLVKMEDASGETAEDVIRGVFGDSAYKAAQREERDQDNAVDAWPERGLLGTQLGPNKNGRKW